MYIEMRYRFIVLRTKIDLRSSLRRTCILFIIRRRSFYELFLFQILHPTTS